MKTRNKLKLFETTTITLALLLTSSCSLVIKNNKSTTTNNISASPTATPTPTATPDSFATAMAGIWRADSCTNIYGSGITVAMNVSGGNSSTLVLMYPDDPTCTGNGAILDMDTFALVTDWPTPAAIVEPAVSGIPANWYIIGPGEYGIVYIDSATHAQFLMTDIVASLGATWADWLSGDVDIAGIVADPLNYVATLNNHANLSLTKVGSVFSAPTAPTMTNIAGIWKTGCADNGDGTSSKWFRGFESNGTFTNFVGNWSANNTCTGPLSSFSGNADAPGTSIGVTATNGHYDFDIGGAYYSLIQKSGDFLFIGKQSSGGTDDATSLPNRHTEINSDAGMRLESAPTSASILGTWISNCAVNGGASYKSTTVYSFSGTYNFSGTTDHWNSNTTCTGAPDTTDGPFTGTYSIGENYKTGYKFDVVISGFGNQYHTIWLNNGYMYHGLPNGDANDASSDGLRSSTLNPDFYYIKQ